MIEYPEAIGLAKQIKENLAGRGIVDAIARYTPHKFAWFSGDPAGYKEFLTGKTVVGAVAYGGKLHIKLSDDCGILLSDGIALRLYSDEKQFPKKHQLRIDFDNGTSLFASVQMYGFLEAYSGESDNPYDQLARTKPDVLSDGFDFSYFKSLLEGVDKARLSAKAFLATEQRIPGLGNGVLQDILFYANMSPKRDVKALSDDELLELFHAIKSTLGKMTAQGGRDTEKDLFGQPLGYKTIMCADTYSLPCPRCGGLIRKEAYLGGSVYYCEECQR